MRQEQFAKEVLESWELSVKKIPESDEKTPDFLAVGGESS